MDNLKVNTMIIRRSKLGESRNLDSGWKARINDLGDLILEDQHGYNATYTIHPYDGLVTPERINGFPLSLDHNSAETKIYFELRREFREQNAPEIEYVTPKGRSIDICDYNSY